MRDKAFEKWIEERFKSFEWVFKYRMYPMTYALKVENIWFNGSKMRSNELYAPIRFAALSVHIHIKDFIAQE